MKRVLKLLTGLLLFLFFLSFPVLAALAEDPVVEIGNITRIDGARENQLFGYGLVIGLNGTGDSNRYQPTIESHANMLSNMGVNVTADQIRSRNVASVMITATLGIPVYSGDTIDVTVSSLGDASSLRGGVLFMTALRAANGEVYAVAQGPVSVGGFEAGQGGSSVSSGHTTTARIPNGAIVEQEIRYELDNRELTLLVREPRNQNFETTRNIAMAINDGFEYLFYREPLARAIDDREIRVTVPEEYRDNVVDFIAKLNNMEVRPGFRARVVVNERTGTVVVGHNVRISTAYVSTGNISVSIRTSYGVSQPEPFSEGETVVIPETSIQVDEGDGHLVEMPGGGTVSQLINALNTIGATPGDIIDILQAIKEVGALYAELEVI
ncbi:MAG TPA: flagellar basal body P-ring protein FlgI [Halanaerobiales bacterium]|nr:flagellar basal body P-ring protein FlgI [Halanaerobiales bacterium]